MRNRRHAASNRDEIPAADCPVPVERLFAPTELDIDDLAEAIRLLLGPDQVPRIEPRDPADSDLLSLPRGATHVMEGTEAL